MPGFGKFIFKINYLLILILLTSCNTKTTADEISKEIQNVFSWAETANMVGDAWVRGDVPSKYAKQTLKKAHDELQKETKKIEQIQIFPDSIQTDKSVVIAGIIQLASKTEEMSRAIAQKNRSAVRQQLRELAAQERSLNIFRTKQQTHEKNL
ncbi:hypothetical protein I8748_25935 [Nostoc sp. CENA67]|uniref:Lipoprotein n=1 Tax=Amazonocrinis nigriterrae CENA67 TaxID=2794033 RepID=A0A8J7HTT1_9NOST|nr:hypothetical protein [Amazonocrinis nigriterrae]MBH8565572.1 hypothetical protein [Amazonocrinis nigriterrae CENA67]